MRLVILSMRYRIPAHPTSYSLRATWIRNSLIYALRQSPYAPKVHAIGQGFVYANPTITKLSSSIFDIVDTPANGVETTETDEEQKGVDEIEELVSEYTKNFPVHSPGPRRVKMVARGGGEVVLVTGTTGGLGAQLVATLAVMPGIARVYALNRPAEAPLQDRQREAFVSRGLDTRLLESKKVVLVEGSLEKEYFGVSRELYDEASLSPWSMYAFSLRPSPDLSI